MDTSIEKLTLALKLGTSSNITEIKEAEKFLEEVSIYSKLKIN